VLAPGLVIEVIATDEIANLVRRDADIAIRHGRPTQDGLIARRCPDTLVRFYAAPSYLAKHGRRVDEAGFDGAELIGFAGRNHEVIAELRRRGVTVEEEQFRFHTNGGTVAWEWVRRGLAIGLMMESVGRMTPDVVALLPRMEPLPVPVWLVTHRELHTSRRIRLVFDLLAESLGG
jgi:DNA-binding transcriptional LysR family regulator